MEAKGCLTRRKQDQGITVITGITIRIVTTTTVGILTIGIKQQE
jgi:hypothetical protein